MPYQKWIKKNYIVPHPNLDFYKVILPTSNGSGALGEKLSSPIIGMPYIGHNQTFISIGSLGSEEEASNLLNYVKSKFVPATELDLKYISIKSVIRT